MKFLAMLLSFYLLFLAAAPCLGKSLTLDEQKRQLMAIAGETDEAPDSDDDKASFGGGKVFEDMLIENPFMSAFDFFYLQISLSIYRQQSPQEIYFSIWQPPKI